MGLFVSLSVYSLIPLFLGPACGSEEAQIQYEETVRHSFAAFCYRLLRYESSAAHGQ